MASRRNLLAKKMPGRLGALSASAVATIYVAGLLSTQSAAENVAAESAGALTALVATPGSMSTTTAADPTSPPSVVVGASAPIDPTVSSVAAQTPLSAAPTAATSTATSTAAVSAAASSTPAGAGTLSATSTRAGAGAATSTNSTAAGAATYANGTYSATGTSSLGNVTVSVTTSAGKITNVQITRVTTKFPVSRIASLPAQVIQKQTANVNVVTGATYSSQAFRQAVQLAMTQALAASSTAAAA
jgi:uncharacterized protein with FMN-binding domain